MSLRFNFNYPRGGTRLINNNGIENLYYIRANATDIE